MVQRTGKFEELMVASHDIAASTAQLVAASRVKARPKSEKLKSLKSSSRDGVCGGERGRRESGEDVIPYSLYMLCVQVRVYVRHEY